MDDWKFSTHVIKWQDHDTLNANFQLNLPNFPPLAFANRKYFPIFENEVENYWSIKTVNITQKKSFDRPWDFIEQLSVFYVNNMKVKFNGKSVAQGQQQRILLCEGVEGCRFGYSREFIEIHLNFALVWTASKSGEMTPGIQIEL